MIQKIYKYLRVYNPTKLAYYSFLELKMFLRGMLLGSYGQWGEDTVIDNLLGGKKRGFYVDIGAYEPSRFSNTKKFYLRGWRGINIEPDPAKIKKFYRERPDDTNLNIGVANKSGVLSFYKFEPNTLSTFSEKSAEDYQKQGFKLLGTQKVAVQRLIDILDKYHKKGSVDFFSIDTEGLDIKVLKSNNWKKFKPKVICIEGGKSAEKFLSSLGYKKVSQTPTNSIFKDSN